MVHLKIGLLSEGFAMKLILYLMNLFWGKVTESPASRGIKNDAVDDFARLIMPNYMAHGLLGNSENIPPQSVLVVDVELLNLQR